MKKISRRRFTNICVFCGTSFGTKSEFVEALQELGRVMAERNMHSVYGGGNLGLMGMFQRRCKKVAVKFWGSFQNL